MSTRIFSVAFRSQLVALIAGPADSAPDRSRGTGLGTRGRDRVPMASCGRGVRMLSLLEILVVRSGAMSSAVELVDGVVSGRAEVVQTGGGMLLGLVIQLV
jgi:hypothetical protein